VKKYIYGAQHAMRIEPIRPGGVGVDGTRVCVAGVHRQNLSVQIYYYIVNVVKEKKRPKNAPAA
jgi:hypothetical protein